MYETIPSAQASLLPAEDVLRRLHVDAAAGLESSDVEKRRRAHGANELGEDDDEPLYMKFVEKLKEPMIALLLGSAGVSLLIGQYDDAISIALVGALWQP